MRSANRVSNLPPYPFAALEKTIGCLKDEGRDLIRLDIGSPDLPPNQAILDALIKTASRSDQHGYGGYFGTPRFRKAVATYYRQRFGVEIDPNNEVISLLGSKEGIANMATAWLDSGDIALVPAPGYPTYSMGPMMAGASFYEMPLLKENAYLPDLKAIPGDVLKKARLMWLNYPNNPTGAVAPEAYLREVVDFCKCHDILLCYDAPYCDNTYDGYVAPSVLQIPGAMDVAIEFNSLSKSHNLAGWRVGMAVGNKDAIKALGLIKSNVDSGIALPVQEMAIVALTGDQSWLKERNAVYSERRDIIIEALHEMGMVADRPKAAIYIWTPMPEGWKSAEYADRLLRETGVSIAPGTTFGQYGEGFARISLVQKADRIREGMNRWREWWSAQN